VTGPSAHAESPARIPLVREMLEDPNISLVPRAVDCRWRYAGLLPHGVTGFNPLRYEVYYGRISQLARWLADPFAASRELNARDQLVHEVLLAVHDYLHCWAVQAIRDLAPELGYGAGALAADSLEAAAFCHLLTEAVATVGLDYWYLSVVDLNAVCDLATTKSTLTTSYRELDAAEFRRADPHLVVQTDRTPPCAAAPRARGIRHHHLALRPDIRRRHARRRRQLLVHLLEVRERAHRIGGHVLADEQRRLTRGGARSS
jgi:hypothetical protein